MNWIDGLVIAAFVLAAWPAYQYSRNIFRYRKPALAYAAGPKLLGQVSILIPARNEENSILAAVESALASKHVSVEVIVLDDHSTDATASIVKQIGQRDPRVRITAGASLPSGWAGKQFACQQLGDTANHEFLLFIDADIRLAPEGVARLLSFLRQTECGLVSGVPRQETGTLLEMLVIPLIHILLLGYLPMGRMRQLRMPALGAGCGQLFLTIKSAYRQVGGHTTIRSSFHDGVKLPRAYRRAGMWTDLCDATDLATCRMYHSGRELWNGLAKNAGEGIGSPRGIVLWTILLAGGHILPFVLIALWPWLSIGNAILVFATVGLSYYPRFHAAFRFHQSWLGVVFHPVGIALLLLIQWYAMLRRVIGLPIGWKGRPKPAV